MRILYRDNQHDLYKLLHNVLIQLAKDPSDEATDAICDTFKIAKIVGVDKELEKVEEKNEENYKAWTDKFTLKHIVAKHM